MSVPRSDFREERSASDLEDRANDLRSDIDMTLDELAARLAPKHLRHAVAVKVRRNGVGLTLMAIRAVRHRPKVAAVAAAALAAGALMRYWNGGRRR